MNKETIAAILRNTRVVSADGNLAEADVEIKDGVITRVGILEKGDSNTVEIDLGGAALLPGLTDLHVHFREPGYSYKGTIRDGSRAAAKGGFTTVCTMPNLNPVPDSLETLRTQTDIIDRDAAIRVLPFASITKKRMGEQLVDYQALAPYVAGFSDDGSGVQDGDVMEEAMKGIAATGKILAAHCEVNSLLRGGYIHDGEWCRVNGHRGICSESEWCEIERDIKLAARTGCRLHICHISTKESVELIRAAKAEGIAVTCETAPHYLVFCDEDMREDARFKMNPPIRSRADRAALIEGIADGTIDVIATDHAPHAAEEKTRGLEKSAMGVVGLETSFAASYSTLVETGIIPFSRLVELMSTNGNRILGRDASGIVPGAPADLAAFDLSASLMVKGNEFVSKGKFTPFEGMVFHGLPVFTMLGGRTVFGNPS